ncbi:glycosyltransferase family 2 protein [Riemerella anatipestifer]|nr:glycosyltransferase family 2 protein [Riemerella anatipestifer]
MLVTIFTPAYNRAHLLPRLYESLCRQTCHDFEWVVVDDGSSDSTEEVMEKFKTEGKIPITFFSQKNSGKHMTINKGSDLAKGELFFIVDSDDFLLPQAVEKIVGRYSAIRGNSEFAGLSFRKGYGEDRFIGSGYFDDIEASAIDFRYRHRIKGDMAEIIKTEVLRAYKFPIIENERFCTEGLLWFRVAERYRFLWISEIIYIAEYLEGGLSDTIFKIRKNSPGYSTLFYSELEKMRIPLLQRVKANINFWRFAKYLKVPFLEKFKRVNPIYSLVGLPFSLLFLIKDRG